MRREPAELDDPVDAIFHVAFPTVEEVV